MTKQIKILYTIPNFITAGSGKQLFNVITRLNPDQYDVTVCVLKSGGALEDQLREHGIEVLEADFTIEALPRLTFLQRAWATAQFFRPYKFDFWHSYHYLSDYTEPIIARMAGARCWFYTKKNTGWNNRQWLLRSMLASHIVANHDHAADTYLNHPLLRHKVSVIKRGVPLDSYSPDIPKRLGLRKQLNIAPDEFMVGYPAQILPRKAQHQVVQAAAQIPDMHVVFAGRVLDEDYAAFLHQMIANEDIAGRVHFLGYVTDVPAMNVELDAVVFTTREDAFPVGLVEALASGLPTVVTDVSGPMEIVVPDETSLVFPFGDIDTLVTHLKRLKDDLALRQQMSIAARKHAETALSIEREVAEHEALYAKFI